MHHRLLAISLATLFACGGDPDGDSATHDGHHGHHGSTATGLDYSTEVMTDGGSWMVSYTASADPIPLSEPFNLDIMAMDHMSGDMVMIDDIALGVSMPSHGHPMNNDPAISTNDDGTVTVTGMLFHMEGWWEMTADMTVMGTTERATFNVDCCQ